MGALDKCINVLITEKTLMNAAVRVGIGDDIILDSYFSHTLPDLDENTLFDMASVTKVISTTSLALIAIDRGLLSISDCVSRFFDVPQDKQELTIENLMCHSMGMGHKNLCLDGVTYDNVAEHILSLQNDKRIGKDYVYSCPAFILLGKILEKIFEKRLDELLYEYVTGPLGMTGTRYLPSESGSFVHCNFSGEKHIVNDYNCRFLGGVAGNAGVFSNISDMTLFAKMLISKGNPIIERNTFLEAIKKHGNDSFSQSRALGYLYVDKKYEQTGRLFRKGSIGHCGHTGQSLFADPESGLYAIILTDATATIAREDPQLRYDYSRVCKMRELIHNAIAEDIK